MGGIPLQLGLISGILFFPAHAGEFNYFLGYRASYTTNINRTPVNEKEEYIHSLVGGFSYVDTSSALNLRVAPSVEYLYYQKKTSENESRLSLDALAIWNISPQQFTWTVEDNLRQVRANPTQPDTPSNTVAANVANTGPDFYLRFGPVNTLHLGARIASVYIEDAEADNTRRQGYARWLYQSSPQTTWSLNYEASAVDFKNEELNRSYRRQDYFLRLQTRPVRSSLDISFGGSKIRQDMIDDINGALARLSLTREITAGTTLGLAADASYGDTGTDLSATAAAANNPANGTATTTSQNLVTQGFFYSKRGTIFYRRAGQQLNMDLRVFYNDLEFETTPLENRQESGGAAIFSYLFAGTTETGVFGNYKRTYFLNVENNDVDINYGVLLSYRVTRTISTTLELGRSERESMDPARNFVDSRVLLSVLYKSGSAGTK